MIPLIWGMVAVLCTAIVFPAIVDPGEPADLVKVATLFLPIAGIVYIALTPAETPLISFIPPTKVFTAPTKVLVLLVTSPPALPHPAQIPSRTSHPLGSFLPFLTSQLLV